jgi:hypothetical protein
MAPQAGSGGKTRLAPADLKQWGLALALAIVLGGGAYYLVENMSQQVAAAEHAISFASTVLGFVTLILGTFMGVQASRSPQGLGDLQTLKPVGLAAGVGAILILAGQFA